MWSAVKGIGIVCVVFACILVIITLFIAIGFAVRIIAIVAAVVGFIWLCGAMIWLGVTELLQARKKP